MAATPHTSIRLSRSAMEWLRAEAKATGRRNTQILEGLVQDAMKERVVACGEDAKWLLAEGQRREMPAEEVLSDTLRTARLFPAAYLAHVNAVQSWTAARLVTAIFNRLYEGDAREILEACAEAASDLFGQEPDRPAVDVPATPKSLRRVFTNIPRMP